MSTSTLYFPPFRLDRVNERLWREEAEIVLRPKALAVLRYLVEHPQRLVSRAELVHAIWGDTKVSESVLRGCLHAVRHALGDVVKAPQFLETVPRRGWRFIGTVVSRQHSEVRSKEATGNWQLETSSTSPISNLTTPAASIVGREAELTQLHGYLAGAANGARQFVFVTGEPGIGKTTVVDAFIAQVASDPTIWIARGQCIEHYGTGEPYLPILEALERLCQTAARERLLPLLRQYAPLWLAQLPGVTNPTEHAELQRQAAGTTRERMLRELATLIERLTTETLLVLVLEDLHWSDTSTLDLLAMLARRRESARLLVIGTYRPIEVLTINHPLRAVSQELLGHGQCQILELEGVTQAAIEEYLQIRFGGGGVQQAALLRLAQMLHRRTEGNFLFVTNIIEDLITRKVVIQEDDEWMIQGTVEDAFAVVPDSIRQLITRQMERLAPVAQQVLEAASVAGAEFSAVAVSAALDADTIQIEGQCEELARRQQFVQRAGIEEWPDHTITARYGFRHALYQQLWHEWVTPSRQQQFHLRIGLRKEEAYTGRSQEIAAELAVHFEQGRDYQRAIQYYGQAAEQAGSRHAYQESIAHLTTALELLRTFPDTLDRDLQEVGLQLSLSLSLARTQAIKAPAFDRVLARQWELSQRLPESPQLFWPLMIVANGHLSRGEFRKAHVVIERCWQLAQHFQERSFFVVAVFLKGDDNFLSGELVVALDILEQGMALYALPQVNRSPGWDYGLASFSYAALILWQLGYPDQAVRKATEALTVAHSLQSPYMEAFALTFLVRVHQLRGERVAAQEYTEQAIKRADEQGFAELREIGHIFHRWALVEHEAAKEEIPQLRHAITTYRANSGEIHHPYYLALLVEVYQHTKQVEEGLVVLDEALTHVECTNERYWEAELYRLKGELTLQQVFKAQGSTFKVDIPQSAFPNPQLEAEVEAEICFLKAIEIACRQSAKSLELRATVSLARLWRRQDKKAEARQKLAEIYGWFTEGFDTSDLKEAKALLEELT